jgi:murein L,D-transpeptidase YafK
MGNEKVNALTKEYSHNSDYLMLWESLKQAYLYFEKNKYPAVYKINAQGKYIIGN